MNLEDLPPGLREQAEGKIAAQRRGKLKNDPLAEKGRKNGCNERQDAAGAFEWEGVPKKKGKYGNKPCEMPGIRFDSGKEQRRYLELKEMLGAGRITELKLQHCFTLPEAFKAADGKAVRKISYVADFTYFDAGGKFVIEDVKSEATRKNPVYSLKKRLMAAKGHEITEV